MMADSISAERDKLLPKIEREQDELGRAMENLLDTVEHRATAVAELLAAGVVGIFVVAFLVRLLRSNGR